MSAQVSAAQLKALRAIVGQSHVTTAETDLLANARDNWPQTIIQVRAGQVEHLPAVVVRPGSAEEVAKVLAYASHRKIPVTPYAAGSGVCGGAIPLQGGISLDVKRLNRVLEIDKISQIVRAESGINGEKLERELNRAGFTLGHFPSSIYTSTLGGWIVTRSAGQMSSKYGKIEDMVESLEIALADGRVVRQRTVPARAAGPDWRALFMGSEGTLGVVTSAALKVRRFPEGRAFASYLFGDLHAGLETFREMLQSGLRPAVMRLYDELDTFLAGSSRKKKEGEEETRQNPAELFEPLYELLRSSAFARPLQFLVGAGASLLPGMLNRVAGLVPKQCKCVLVFEGSPDRCALEKDLAHEIALRHGARDTGEGPARHWLERRYAVSYRQQVVFDNFAFADTMEVAATWEKLPRLYLSVREALSRHCLVMAHFSHAYPDGCSIYFTFVGAGINREAAGSIYRRTWDEALAAAIQAGGTFAHHHGVGVHKGAFMEKEHGAAMEFLRAAKGVLDPSGVLNPGKLGLS